MIARARSQGLGWNGAPCLCAVTGCKSCELLLVVPQLALLLLVGWLRVDWLTKDLCPKDLQALGSTCNFTGTAARAPCTLEAED
jgi:hypothetical protein